MQEKIIFVNGMKTNCKIFGSGFPFLILHGWGGSSDSWINVAKILSKDFLVICPDFPGFGKSETPKTVWELKDFAEWLKKLSDVLKLNKFLLLGHSFGGRVAIKFSILYPERVEGLILCSSAGIKQKWGLKEKIIFLISLVGNFLFSQKILKRFKDKARNLFYRFLRNRDYAKAKGTMREILKKILEEDLLSELKKIRVKTFIVWGEKDNILPIKYALIFKQEIKDSSLITLPNLHHAPHLEAPEKLAKVLFEIFKRNFMDS